MYAIFSLTEDLWGIEYFNNYKRTTDFQLINLNDIKILMTYYYELTNS